MKSENEIPKFDLARQIMSTQRKFSAGKRIAPTKRKVIDRDRNRDNTENVIENKKPETNPNTIPITMNDCSSDKIISDIVARDIHNLRKR